MKLIVGLGNPGVQYELSRHNVGFRVVDRLAEISRIFICAKRFKTFFGKGRIDSEEVVLIKPITFMNLSGEGVRKTANFFHLGIEDIIVIHDDIDLPFGRLRFKRKGGDGGHQGVRSIIESLGENAFLRLKVGVGRPPKEMDPANYVLAPFNPTERSDLDAIISRGAEAVVVLLREGINVAMNRYQRKNGTSQA